jgi:hypothetical protein
MYNTAQNVPPIGGDEAKPPPRKLFYLFKTASLGPATPIVFNNAKA